MLPEGLMRANLQEACRRHSNIEILTLQTASKIETGDMYIYIYIYIDRERERRRERSVVHTKMNSMLCVCVWHPRGHLWFLPPSFFTSMSACLSMCVCAQRRSYEYVCACVAVCVLLCACMHVCMCSCLSDCLHVCMHAGTQGCTGD